MEDVLYEQPYDDEPLPPLDAEPERGCCTKCLRYTGKKSCMCCLRCCGITCWILLGFCIVAWITHAISVDGGGGLASAPVFARSLIWRTLAYHTDAYSEWQLTVSPPPPYWLDPI